MIATRTKLLRTSLGSVAVLSVLSGAGQAVAHPPVCATAPPVLGVPTVVANNAYYAELKQRLARQHADQVRWIHREYSDRIRQLNRVRADAAKLPQPYRAQRFAQIDQQKRDAAYARKQQLGGVNHAYQSQREQLRLEHRLATIPLAQPIPRGPWAY